MSHSAFVKDGAPGADADSYAASPGDRPPTSANARDDEFTGAGLDAKWTTLNSPVYVQGNGYATVRPSIQNAHKLCGYEQAIPTTGDVILAAKIGGPPPTQGSAVEVGLFFKNSTNGKIVTFGSFATVTPSTGYTFERWTDKDTWASQIGGNAHHAAMKYLRLALVGTTMSPYVSNDGIAWSSPNLSEAIASHIGTVRGDVNRCGIYVDAHNGAGAVDATWAATFEWFRVT